MAISGGVDSTVLRCVDAPRHRRQLKCVFVDTGLLRKGEAETVAHVFREHLGLGPSVIDARRRVLAALRGLTDAQEKRRAVERVFSQVMRAEASCSGAEFLVSGCTPIC